MPDATAHLASTPAPLRTSRRAYRIRAGAALATAAVVSWLAATVVIAASPSSAPSARAPAPSSSAASGLATGAGTPELPVPPGCPRVLQHTFNMLQTGQAQSLCQYQGKVILIVNTASFCGYTTQYEGLEALYRKYRDSGLVVVGFPSNDFGGQEPGSNKEIAEFCRTTYGVQFPLYEKTAVARLAGNPLYMDLARATGQAPKWNFHKYVVDRDGTPVASFPSDVTPDARDLVALIEKLLARKAAAGKV